MLAQAGRVTLALLLFRAGPQDFPFSETLTRGVVAVTLAVAYVQYQLTLAPVPALVQALASVALLFLFTRSVLHLRRFPNRVQQTVNSLFAAGTALTLVSLPALAALAPHLLRLQQSPELMRQEPLPTLPALAVLSLSVWNFLVTANIYRHALEARPAWGAVAALAAALVTVTLSSAVTSLFV